MRNYLSIIIILSLVSCASPTDGEIYFVPVESGLQVEGNWYTGEGCESAFIKNKSPNRITFKVKINKMERADDSSPWVQKESTYETITLDPDEEKELSKTLQFLKKDRRYLGSIFTEGKRYSYDIVDATYKAF